MQSSRASAMKRTNDGPLAQNALVVDRCLAQYIHMINTGAVPIYAELRVMHFQTRTDRLLLLRRVRLCPLQHKSADRPSAHEVEE